MLTTDSGHKSRWFVCCFCHLWLMCISIRSGLIHFVCIGVAPPWLSRRDQSRGAIPCRRNGLNMIYISINKDNTWSTMTRWTCTFGVLRFSLEYCILINICYTMSSLFLFWSNGVGKPDSSLCPSENLLCVVTLSFLPLGMLGQHETYT